MAMQAEKRQAPVQIPVIDAPDGPLQLARILSAQLPRIVGLIHRTIPPALLGPGDTYAARCLRDAGNPYIHEIIEIARLLGSPAPMRSISASKWAARRRGCHAAPPHPRLAIPARA
jgi:hypothetical protein